MELKEIDRDKLIPSEWNPRSSFDEEKLKLLRESINGIGLVEPLVVRPHPNKKDTYFITAGERRWQSKPNGKFLCLIRDESEIDSKVACLVENYVRENIDDEDHEKFICDIFKEGSKSKKWESQNVMSKITGIPRAVISQNIDAHSDRQKLSLMEPSVSTDDMIESKSLKDKPKVRKKLLKRRAKGEVSGHHAVRNWSKELNKLPEEKALEVVDDANDLNDVKVAVEIHEGTREEGFYVNGIERLSKVERIKSRCEDILTITPVFIDTIKKESDKQEAIGWLKDTYEHLLKLLTELNALGVIDIDGKELE